MSKRIGYPEKKQGWNSAVRVRTEAGKAKTATKTVRSTIPHKLTVTASMQVPVTCGDIFFLTKLCCVHERMPIVTERESDSGGRGGYMGIVFVLLHLALDNEEDDLLVYRAKVIADLRNYYSPSNAVIWYLKIRILTIA